MARSPAWSIAEINATIESYFKMLTFELKGIAYNKSHERRLLLKSLSGRNEQAIEYKHRNISAILRDHGKQFVSGYKPADHIQNALETEVLKYLEANAESNRLFESFAQQPYLSLPKEINFEKLESNSPETSDSQSMVKEEGQKYGKRRPKIDYIKREQANAKLGELGEELIVNYEKWRLKKEGESLLSTKVVWVSKELGDGYGYDILSKNSDGSDRFIEVKTTKSGKHTPIYFSRNELSFSQNNYSSYFLYRVYQYGENPKFFHLKGSLDSYCNIEPTNYVGRF